MITFIVPTVGRASLARTLASIELWPGDEILLVGDVLDVQPTSRNIRRIFCLPGCDWGHAERNFATPFARGRYIAHIDDDDTYVPGARALMEDAILRTPDRPVLFRMRFPCGITLWDDPVLRCGNIGTPCILIPNVPEKLGTWGSFVGGDCAFLEGMGWPQSDIVWRPEIIALLGHDIGAAA